MKRIIIILTAISYSICVHSQNSMKAIFSAEGSYNQTSVENGVSRDLNATEGHYFIGGISAGHFLTDRFVVGVGFEFNHSTEDRHAVLILNDSYIQEQMMKIKSSLFLPYLYTGWYFKISNDFYFNLNFKISYGEIRSEYESIVAARSKLSIDTFYSPIDESIAYSASFENSSKSDYFSAGFHPQITYFLSKNFGLYISLGGLEYSLLDWQNENSKWNANFNPSNWKFGVKWRLQSDQTSSGLN